MEKGGFSFASVILGYFMVAGGICAALLVLSRVVAAPGEIELAAAFAAGGFVGGFFAARASRGSTILEPGLAAVLVVGTFVALFLATPVGRWLSEYIEHGALVMGSAALVATLLGAFLSEKIFGAATTSAIPWVLYVALAAAGACFLAFLAAGAVRFSSLEPSTVGSMVETDRATQLTVLAGIAGGCLLAGLASGASARQRVLAASFLGASAGVFGFFVLAATFRHQELDRDGFIGAGAFAIGGGVIALVSAALGWAVVGRRE